MTVQVLSFPGTGEASSYEINPSAALRSELEKRGVAVENLQTSDGMSIDQNATALGLGISEDALILNVPVIEGGCI